MARRRAIAAGDLAGQSGLRRSARDAILARQPVTVAKALEIADVGRKTTRRLLELEGRGGQFRFIAVDGWMSCQHGQRNGRPHVTFTWEGNDECDPARGRGWARLLKDGLASWPHLLPSGR